METTSSRKLAKLARQTIEKDYRRTVEEEAREMGRMLGNAMKPKPEWVPMWLWMKGVRIFINVR